jgi:hypothetical protein
MPHQRRDPRHRAVEGAVVAPRACRRAHAPARNSAFLPSCLAACEMPSAACGPAPLLQRARSSARLTCAREAAERPPGGGSGRAERLAEALRHVCCPAALCPSPTLLSAALETREGAHAAKAPRVHDAAAACRDAAWACDSGSTALSRCAEVVLAPPRASCTAPGCSAATRAVGLAGCGCALTLPPCV